MIYQEMWEHKETVMIAQLLKEEGIQEGNLKFLSRLLAKKYHRSSETIAVLLEGLSAEDFLELGEYMLDCDAFDDIEQWISRRKQDKADGSPLN